LAATWLMMSVEGPFLAAIIARMPNPKYNLAAYGVAFAFALIIEAPIIMMSSAATALVQGAGSLRKLRHFNMILIVILTGLVILLVLKPVYYYLTIDLMHLEKEVARLSHLALTILLPWPGAIGYRRFYQGVLIRSDLTRRVAYGTITRLIAMLSTATLLFSFSRIEGALIGAFALSVGVISEAITIRIMVHPTLKNMLSCADDEPQTGLTFSEITRFYYPLALTSFLGLVVQPMVTFLVGRSRMALESLAVLPVVNALIFIFRSIGLSYQEVGIALAGEHNESIPALRNFALILAAAVTLILTLIAFTPLMNLWLLDVSGLTEELSTFARLPIRILILMPGLSVILSFLRAIMVNIRKTRFVTVATGIEVLVILIVLWFGIFSFDWIGASAAAAALLIGRMASDSYLLFKNSRLAIYDR